MEKLSDLIKSEDIKKANNKENNISDYSSRGKNRKKTMNVGFKDMGV